ncbi:MAG TPA: hypothetical protein VHB78_04875 [Vicinamibacterales bacterium]|nr:hypothetical protein [Vicinamibacterales bacterium]
MSRRVLSLSALAAVLALPLRAAAQTPPPVSAADEAAKSAVFTYATALRGAVLVGGQKLAQQASTVVPELVLAPSEQPTVRGVKLDGWGFFFDVQIPEIWNSTMMLWDMLNQSRHARATPPGASGPAQPVSDRPTVSATGPVEPDPMANELATQGGRDRLYSNYVREALIDALLDSSAVLPLGPTDRLTIAASGIDQPGSNPLYQERKLMLTIKGSDLQDLRQGRITREEARARVVEGRF